MADDDWLFGANKVDEKLVIGEPEQSGKHNQTARQRQTAAEGRRSPSTPPPARAHTVNPGQPQSPSTPGASNVATTQQRDAATASQSDTSMESQRRDDTIPIQRDALAGTRTPAPRQAYGSIPASRDAFTPPLRGSTAPQQLRDAPQAPLNTSVPLPSSTAAAPSSGDTDTPTTDDFDPWADGAEDVDDSWTVSAETPSSPGVAPSSGSSMPPQSWHTTERQPSQPAGQTQDDGWFTGQQETTQQSIASTTQQSVPAQAESSNPSVPQQSNDDWFTGDSVQQPNAPSTAPQSAASMPQQSGDGVTQSYADDWFTGDASRPPQSNPATPPSSETGAVPGQTTDDDGWFTGDASTPQQSGAGTAQPRQPAAPQPGANPTMEQQPAEDGWFDGQQSNPSVTPQSYTAVPPSAQQGNGNDWFDDPTPQQSNPSAPQQSGQDPWEQQDGGGETQQQGDDWFTPATGADAMPTADDPWADPTPAGEWNQTTQPAQTATMPIPRPTPQPQSYAPAPAAPVQPDIEEGNDNETDSKAIWKPLLVILACVLALGLIGFGGYYGYNAYHHNMEERAAQEASQQALKELNKSKASYEADKKQARTLVTKMRTGIVKDDPDVAKQAEALDRLASLSMPRTKKAIGEADTTLNKQYETAMKTYQSKVKAKCDTVAKALTDLAGQSDQLASAPDSTDKSTMQSLAKKWRDKTVSEDTYAEAVKAQTDLQNAVNAVQAAKAQADAAAQQAAQQAQQQAEAQAQAQQQQQQSQKKSTTTQKRSSSSGSSTKRYSSGGSTQRRPSTPRRTTAPQPVPQPAPQPAQPPMPSGESGVNLG